VQEGQAVQEGRAEQEERLSTPNPSTAPSKRHGHGASQDHDKDIWWLHGYLNMAMDLLVLLKQDT
jgi:hypothetical protein